MKNFLWFPKKPVLCDDEKENYQRTLLYQIEKNVAYSILVVIISSLSAIVGLINLFTLLSQVILK